MTVTFPIFRRWFTALGVFLFTIFCNAEVDEERLWLPTSHLKLYLKLKMAAENVDALERCHTLLRGTIDFELSTEEQPIFRFLCRRENGVTYSEMVDAHTGKTLTALSKQKGWSGGSAATASLISIEDKLVAELKQRFLKECEQKTRDKISIFEGASVYRDDHALKEFKYEYIDTRAELDNITAIYVTDFDAKDIDGKTLEYRAICSYESDDRIRVAVKKRKISASDSEAST